MTAGEAERNEGHNQWTETDPLSVYVGDSGCGSKHPNTSGHRIGFCSVI